MSLRARFALAFALVSAVVAGLVGGLSYHAVAEQTTQANDTTLAAATTALAENQTGVLGSTPAPPGDDGGGPPRGDRGPGTPPPASRCWSAGGSLPTAASRCSAGARWCCP